MSADASVPSAGRARQRVRARIAALIFFLAPPAFPVAAVADEPPAQNLLGPPSEVPLVDENHPPPSVVTQPLVVAPGIAPGIVPVAVPVAAPVPAPAPAPVGSDVERRLRALEEQNQRLTEQLQILREDHDSVETRLSHFIAGLSGRLTGYMDFGLFDVTDNKGSGIVPDLGHKLYPSLNNAKTGVTDSWVFIGDPLSTAVNSRGEPADTGASRAVTFDSIHNGGQLSFIVNSLTLNFFAGIGQNLTFNATLDLVPRSRNISDPTDPHYALGDFIDLRLVYAEYRVPINGFDLRLYAGKFDSLLGIEYRSEESPDRIGVTPSLICRYTCGHPLGLKARARFGKDLFVVNLAVTNGSSQVEYFPFYDEIDTNLFKTIAGRISTKLPLGSGLEIGASGAFGAQDFVTQTTIASVGDVWQWHYGFDLHLAVRDLDVRAEFVQGEAQGKDSALDTTGDPMQRLCDLAPCLAYRGAYGQVAYRVLNWLIPYVRVDGRDALHRDGESFIYISKLARVTGGVRVELGESVIIKAEYTRIQEVGPLPAVPVNNNVLTSSMVVKY